MRGRPKAIDDAWAEGAALMAKVRRRYVLTDAIVLLATSMLLSSSAMFMDDGNRGLDASRPPDGLVVSRVAFEPPMEMSPTSETEPWRDGSQGGAGPGSGARGGRSPIFSTFLGGLGNDSIECVAFGRNDTIVVAGTTDSPQFPTTPGAFCSTLGGGWGDVFVCVLGPDGDELRYSTLLSGYGNEYTVGLAVDQRGIVYLAGTSDSPTFPLPGGPSRGQQPANYDAFVCSLDPDLSRVRYMKWLGGAANDSATDMALCEDGSVVVVGTTASSDFPVTPGCLVTDFTGPKDGFVVKLAADGDRAVFATYVTNGSCKTVDVEANDAIWVAGMTTGPFATTEGAYMRERRSTEDGFIWKLLSDGSSLVFSTLWGGRGSDSIEGMDVEDYGGAYFVMRTSSDDLPVPPYAYRTGRSPGSVDDVYVAQISEEGTSRLYSTYLGTSGSTVPRSIIVNDMDLVTVAGYVESGVVGTTTETYQSELAGLCDAFICVLGEFLDSMVMSTYFGGASWDQCGGLLVDDDDTVFLAGVTLSSDLPITDDAPFQSFGGPMDGFVSRFHMDLVPPQVSVYDDLVLDQGQCPYFRAQRPYDRFGIVNWTWTFTGPCTNCTIYGEEVRFDFVEAGVYSVTLTARDRAGNAGSASLLVTVNDTTPPVAEAGPDIIVDQNATLWIDGSASYDNVGIEWWSWSVYDKADMSLIDTPVRLIYPQIEVRFEKLGEFVFLLRVVDAAGNEANDTMNVTVIDGELPIAEAGPDIRVDQHALVTFDGTGSTDNIGVVRWQWSISSPDGMEFLEGPSPTFLFEKAGDYWVQLGVFDAQDHYSTDTMQVHVRDTTRPVAEAGPVLTTDQLVPVVLDGSGSTDNVGIVQSWWSIHIGNVLRRMMGLTVELMMEDPGDYPAELTVIDSEGNMDNDTTLVRVHDIMPPTSFAGFDRTVPSHTTVELNGSGSSDNAAVVRWVWIIMHEGSATTLEGQVTEYLCDQCGPYHVELTVYDASHLSSTDAMTIMVVDRTPPTARMTGGQEATAGVLATFDGSGSTDDVGIGSWTWEVLGGATRQLSRGPVLEVYFDAAGTYVVTVTVEDAAGNRGVSSMNVTVVPPEPPHAGPQREPSPNGDVFVALGLVVILGMLVLMVTRARSQVKGR